MNERNYHNERNGSFRGRPENRSPEFNLESSRDDFKSNEANPGTIKNWILNGIDKNTNEFANHFGKYIAQNELTTSQIRATFGEMRRIQLNSYKKEKVNFILLMPKLAYAVKRHNKRGLSKFYEFFSIAYNAVDTKDDSKGEKHFENMMNLMEAILAYHKFHGGN